MASLERVDATPAEPTAAITDAEAEAMARAVVNLFACWAVRDHDACILLGGISPRTYARWKEGRIGRIPRDLKARLSNLMGIHKALRIIFADPQRAYAWVRRPNAAFGGASALDVMLNGDLTNLMRVRRYLDAERGAW